MENKPRLIVLGGGMGAMSALWELTSRPEILDRYRIDVYQQGWRLGGKAASGRNADVHQRIEEHGLHVWMGFYQNAFRVVRECYTELHGDPQAWKRVFVPHSHIALEQRWGGGWQHWKLDFPTNDLTPGDAESTPTPWQYIKRIIKMMAHMADDSPYLQSIGFPDRIFEEPPPVLSRLREHVTRFDVGLGRMLGSPKNKASDVVGELFAAALPLVLSAPDSGALASEEERTLVKVLERLRQSLRNLLTPPAEKNFEAFQMLALFDFGLTNVIGMIRDGLVTPPYRYETIDHLDYKAWLAQHGALESTRESAPVTALYDLVFSIYKGIAAGTTLICVLRMLFSYSGAIFYKVRGGMGDVVFGPLYRVLSDRGVRFHFFHRVRGVHVSPLRDRVERVTVGRQATLKADGYEPLVEIDGRPCWPSAPHWDQLVEGDELRAGDEIPSVLPGQPGGYDLESHWSAWADRETLTIDVGPRDVVLFGISLGALPVVGQELVAANPRLGDLVANVPTVATQALQLWTDRSLAELGWEGKGPVSGAYEEPFDTYAAMDHLLAEERWPAGAAPKHVAYFCGYLDDPPEIPAAPAPAFPESERRRARENSVAWMNQHLHQLWPKAGKPGAFDFGVLHDPQGRVGALRLEAQYYRANPNPSDRYVLSTPGSTRFRLRADETGFSNLVFAGDWLRTGVNGGCIEAATMGGLQASRRISGLPATIVGDPEAPAIVPLQDGTTTYLDRGGDIVLRPPYQQDGATLFGFVLRTGLAPLRQLADRYLNHGKLGYEPVAPFVLLMFADIKKTYSLDPRDRSKGWMTERDVSFWVPLQRRNGRSGVVGPLRWFLPYIWVDNGIAMAAGREVFGFPKQVGDLVIPTDPSRAHALSVATDVLDDFGDDRPVVRRTIIDVRSTGDAPGLMRSARSAWNSAAEAATALARSAGLDELGLSGWARLELTRLVFLKRFRDIVDGSLASYQAVVEASARPTQIRGGGFLGDDFEVRLSGAASHPMVEELFGSELGRSATLKPVTSFWVDFDFSMDMGEEVWRATGPRT